MTQPKTLTVEQTEILARANEVEDALPTLPSIAPVAPCGLKPADTAARQLKLSCDNMLSYLQAGHTEWTRLATSMRNAAKAYGEVDESGAAAMTSEGDAAIGESTGLADGVQSSAAVNDTQVSAAGGPDFTDLKTAAQLIEKPDQATSMRNFASKWIDYNLTLQELVTRFRCFQNWDGDAAAAVTASMDQQTQWVQFMAKLSVSMAKQAQFVADLHAWAYAKHPRYDDVVGLERAYAQATDEYVKQKIMNVYAEYQATSNEVVGDYNSKGTLDPINPPKPPPAVKIDAPPPQGLIPGQVMNVLAAGGGSGSGTPMMPSMPSSGGSSGGSGMGSDAGATLAGAAHHEAPKAPSLGGAGMKPMSVGGIGGGAPSMPLGPAIDAGAAGDSMRPAAATDLAGAGRGNVASGSGMAGGGGGMPMGGHGGGQGSNKNKSSQQDDEALYKEDRAWTEAVIGNRRRPDGKESK
jgi:hypothetical protein